jgi:23S rRNA pseudouridine2604 synthase
MEDKSLGGAEKKAAYPMRINKYLALKQYSTRRGADELIEKKLVYLNGRLAVLGDKVGENDTVEVKTKGLPQKEYLYFAYNKPKGVTTHSPQEGEDDIKTATAKFPELKDVFPIGRLDKDSHGLIILSNDGRIVERLLSPEGGHEKEYLVTVQEKLRDSFKKNMEKGVDIGDYVTKPCTVNVLDDHMFKIIITEGKKHQVRRMVMAMHDTTTDLERIRIANIKLGNLKRGNYRKIEGKELQTFLKALGM